MRDRLDALRLATQLADEREKLASFERELEQALAGLLLALGGKSDASSTNRIDVFGRLVREADKLFNQQQAQFNKQELMRARLDKGHQEAVTLEARLAQAAASLETWQ